MSPSYWQNLSEIEKLYGVWHSRGLWDARVEAYIRWADLVYHAR